MLEFTEALIGNCFASEVEPLTDKFKGLAEGLTDREAELELTRFKGLVSIDIGGIGELPIGCAIKDCEDKDTSD